MFVNLRGANRMPIFFAVKIEGNESACPKFQTLCPTQLTRRFWKPGTKRPPAVGIVAGGAGGCRPEKKFSQDLTRAMLGTFFTKNAAESSLHQERRDTMIPIFWRGLDRSNVGPNVATWHPLLPQFDTLLSDLIGAANSPGRRDFSPTYDIDETSDHFVMFFDMPGVHRDDINIEVLGNQLVVAGERKQPGDGSDSQRLAERRYGKFERSFTLPEGIDANAIEAEHRDGVLRLKIAKPAATKPIKITIAEGSMKPNFLKKFVGEKRSTDAVEVQRSRVAAPT